MSSPITIHNAPPRQPAPEYEFRLPALARLSASAAQYQLNAKTTAGPAYLYAQATEIAARYGIPLSRLPEIRPGATAVTLPNVYQLDRMIRIAIDTPGATEARTARDAAAAAGIACEENTQEWMQTKDRYYAAQKALTALIASALTAAGY